MSYSEVKKPELYVVGLECKTSNNANAAPIDIPRLKDRFINEKISERISNKASDDVISLYCDYEGDYTKPYNFVIGHLTTSIDNIPKGLVGKKLPASKYVHLKAVGEFPQALIDTWVGIWQNDFPRTYTGDFEVYGKEFYDNPPVIDVYVAVK